MTNKKGAPVADEKVNLLKQDIDLATIMALFKKKKKPVEEEIIDENAGADFIPALPEVNLLPERIKEVYAAEDLLRKFLLIGAATLGFFGLLWGTSFMLEQSNEKRIAEVQAQTSDLQAQSSTLQPYANYAGQIEAKRQEISAAMTSDINPGEISSEFMNVARGAGYNISSINVTLNSDGGGTCVNPDPFKPAQGIGCLTFELEGDGSMTKLFGGLTNTELGFVNPYIPSALAATGEAEPLVTGSVSFTEKFYTKSFESYSSPLDNLADNPAEVAPAPEGQ
ncbi:MAG: hypothetical protein H9W81_07330 [Enterococcus sp.]|nr:hypothetical protein [Enterococcus sp.]